MMAVSPARRAQLKAASAAGLAARVAATKARHAALRASAPKCGRPKRDGTPCQRPLINGKCLTHDTMTAEQRAAHCRSISALGAAAVLRGEAHPNWKGDDAQRHTGRHRAQRLFAAHVCEACGATENLHRHHRDENPLNNRPENVAILCQDCHAKAHGGKFAWFNFGGDETD